MTEFVGRTGSKRAYSYPETRAGANTLSPFARNYGQGPALESATLVASAGTEIPWSTVDVPGTDPLHDIPITPQSTGNLMVQGVVSLRNTSEIQAVRVQIQVEIGLITPTAYPIPRDEEVEVPLAVEGAAGVVAVPFSVEIPGQAVGVTTIVRILVTDLDGGGTTVFVTDQSSTCEVQEVAASTG